MLGVYRFFLAVGVLFSHGFIVPGFFGRAMVSAFFIISGYLMTLTLTKNYGKKILPFYWNRIIRIFPLHIAACIVILIFDFIYDTENSIVSTMTGSEILASFLLVPTAVIPINPPSWSLSYEFAFYLIIPFLLIKGVLFPIGLVVILCGYLIIKEIPLPLTDPFLYSKFPSLHPDPYDFMATGMPAALILFCLGIIIFFLSKKFKIQNKKIELVIFAGLPTIFIVSFIFLPVSSQNISEMDIAFFNLSIVLLTSFLLLTWNYKEYDLSFFLGELSYPFYLIHMKIIYFFNNIKAYSIVMFSLSNFFGGKHYFALIISAAYIACFTFLISFFWLSIEKKIRRYRMVVK